MNDAELNKLLFQAYLFGQLVLHAAVDMPEIKAADDRTWDLLRELRDGETTIVDPESMLRSIAVAPHRAKAIKNYLERTTPKVVEHHREMARRILEGADQRP